MTSKLIFKSSFLFISFCIVFTTNVISQCLTIDLIKNPGLEEYTCCPNNAGMIDCANYWTQPLIGNSSSEYLNVCGIDSLLSQDMLPFWQHAHFGNGYAGILVFSCGWCNPQSNDYREYIQGELSQPLIAGQCYYCQFWVKLFNFENLYSYTATDAISIYFSDTIPQKTPIDSMAMYFHAQINNQTGRIITDTSNWTLISDTFTAQGDEKYFTVGTFKQVSEVNQIYFGTPPFSNAYYFFDNFSLCPCGDTIPVDTIPTDTIKPILEVYPNPAKDELFILFNGYEHLNTIDLEVYNILGELVMSRAVESSQVSSKINIGQMASGCYVVVLKSAVKTLYKERMVVIR